MVITAEVNKREFANLWFVPIWDLKRQFCRYRRSGNFRILNSLYAWLVESCCFLNKFFLKALFWNFWIFFGWLYLIGPIAETHTVGGNRKGSDFIFKILRDVLEDCYFFDWLYFIQCVTFFHPISHYPLAQIFLIFCRFVSSNTENVLPISPSADLFFFVYFKVHCKDWLTFSSGTDRLWELCYIFLSQATLFRLLTFQLISLIVILTVPYFEFAYVFWTWFLELLANC